MGPQSTETAEMDTRRYFGVGCIPPKVKDAKDAEDWTERTRNAFESIPSVHNFNILGVEDLEFIWEGKIGTPGDEEIPLPSIGAITFDVRIPARIQKQISIFAPVEGIEEFKVITLFHYVHPVTFIECINPSGDDVPNSATALAIVRDFLKAELQKQRSDVELFMIGPSPFHADFSLSLGEGEDIVADGFTVTINKGLGYDQFSYFHDAQNSHREATGSDALWNLFTIIHEELCYFYRFVSLRNERLSVSSSLGDKAQELADLFKKRGASAFLRRTLTVRHKLQSAQLETISARITTMQHSRSTKEDLEGLYPRKDSATLSGYLQKVTEESYLEEIEGTEKILEVLESRHSQEVQRFATIAFSMLGVVVGSVLTAAFRIWWG